MTATKSRGLTDTATVVYDFTTALDAEELSYTCYHDTAVVSIYDCCILNICVLIYDICILFNNKICIYNTTKISAMNRRFCCYKNVKMAKKCVYDSCIREQRYLEIAEIAG